MSERLVVDDLVFDLKRSPNRRSLGITVDRGAELTVHAPPPCPVDTIEAFVRRKRFWVYSKLALKGLLFAHSTVRDFVTGETFHYLGRSYRLKLVEGSEITASAMPLRLFGGFFLLPRGERQRAEKHFRHWYSRQAEAWLPPRVERLARRLGVVPGGLSIRDLGHRWGSCGAGGRIYVHWSTLQLPPRIVEYVLGHEILHLAEPRHSVDFWRRLERAMPDLAERRRWLAENGAQYAPWRTPCRAAS
jgi:predicted metal-dependent hydrolase